jgi:hypothetical protein
MTTQSPAARRAWASPVAQASLRALYRGVARGLVDDDLLLEVGWALWARARDVAQVSTAVHTGRVPCPICGGEAIRLRRLAYRHTPRGRPVRCEHCDHAGDWSDVREALRRRPLCLSCGAALTWRYAEGELECPACSVALSFTDWLRRANARATLPCPRCLQPLRRPAREAVPGPAPVVDPSRALCAACGATHTPTQLRAHWRAEPRCPCGAALVAEGRLLRCEGCGRELTRGHFTRLLARRRTGPCPACGARVSRPRDDVQCLECGETRPWTHFRRAWEGRHLVTGAGVPVCEQFVAHWPTCRAPAAQMIAVDSFLHALHFGPLAPLLVQGERASVLALLDELGGLR